jgi:hypothetical protein
VATRTNMRINYFRTKTREKRGRIDMRFFFQKIDTENSHILGHVASAKAARQASASMRANMAIFGGTWARCESFFEVLVTCS